MINTQNEGPSGTRRWYAYGPRGRLVGQVIELKSKEKVLLKDYSIITTSSKNILTGFIGKLRYIGRR